MENNHNEFKIKDYIYILINSFSYLQSSSFSSLSFLASPFILVSICSEVNENSFSLLKDNITISNTYGVIFSDLNDIISQIQSEVKEYLKESIKIDIVQLMNNSINEQVNLSKLLIILAFTSRKKNIFQNKTRNFSEQYQKYLFDILNQYVNTLEISFDFNDEIMDNYNESIIQKQKEEIEELKRELNSQKEEFIQYKADKENQISILNSKIELLKEKIRINDKKKVYLKDYDSLLEKSKLYDKLIIEYEQLKDSITRERDTLNDFTRPSNSTQKWDLTEQDYLIIIDKKDYDIKRLQQMILKYKEQLKGYSYSNTNSQIESMQQEHQKEMEDLQHQYELEFELISSALYNIGLNFQEVRLENNFLKSKKKNWLARQKEKYINENY